MEVEVGSKYRHFKGHIYEIICIAKDSENLSLEVVYKQVDDDKYWVRDYNEFISKVDKEKYPDITQEYRFEKMD